MLLELLREPPELVLRAVPLDEDPPRDPLLVDPDDDPPCDPPPPCCASAANGRRAISIAIANILIFIVPSPRQIALPCSYLTAWFCGYYTTIVSNVSIPIKNL